MVKTAFSGDEVYAMFFSFLGEAMKMNGDQNIKHRSAIWKLVDYAKENQVTSKVSEGMFLVLGTSEDYINRVVTDEKGSYVVDWRLLQRMLNDKGITA